MRENTKKAGNVAEPVGTEVQIRVCTFGGMSVYVNNSPITIVWESQKARLLFCCLLVTFDQWVHRQKIIEAVWPGCTPASGEKNFKTTLSRLRKSFSGSRTLIPVLTQGEAVRLNYMAISVDASEFRNFSTQGIKLLVRGEVKAARKSLEAAQDLFRGAFLPEEPHNQFITTARLELAELYVSVIKALEKSYLLEGNSDALEVFSFLKNGPLSEPS
jgi:DNA-binding SARP family transcriptional activator